MDKHIQGKREGCDYYNNSGERQDEWSWQTFFFFFFLFFALQQWVCAAVIVCFCERAGEEKRERCYPHSREPVVCKAVSLDIASAEERIFPFFHSLRYTLINLLKAATPVSSSLTHLKRQTALNPTRIFSVDASKGKKKKKKKSAQPCN